MPWTPRQRTDAIEATGQADTVYSALVDGDVCFSINAYHDGIRWQRADVTKPSWLLLISLANVMTGESYRSLTLWRAAAGAGAIGAFAAVGGWLLVMSASEYGDVSLGSYGIEIDGNGTVPYGRLQHATVSSSEKTGLLTNAYLDESGRDDAASPCWFFGRVDDGFKVRRAVAASGAPTWSDLLTVGADGGLVTALAYVGTGLTVAQLNALTVTQGARSFCTDANATTFASVVAGGGSNKVPVYYDGAWRIG